MLIRIRSRNRTLRGEIRSGSEINCGHPVSKAVCRNAGTIPSWQRAESEMKTRASAPVQLYGRECIGTSLLLSRTDSRTRTRSSFNASRQPGSSGSCEFAASTSGRCTRSCSSVLNCERTYALYVRCTYFDRNADRKCDQFATDSGSRSPPAACTDTPGHSGLLSTRAG